MSDITTEQKLRLVQQVRSRYGENQNDMSNRERILYGRTSAPAVSGWEGGELQSPAERPVSSFRIRMFLAILLFAAFVFMDMGKLTVGGLTAEKIYGMISVDYEERLAEWVETLSGGAQN